MTQRKQPTGATAAFVAGAACTALTALPSVGHAQSVAEVRPEEIVVTSSIIPMPRRQIGTAVSVIEGTDIQLRGYEGLADVLRTQTGIGVTNSGGPGKSTTLRIRGEEGYRTMLMIDGVKAVDPSATTRPISARAKRGRGKHRPRKIRSSSTAPRANGTRGM